MRDAEIKLVMQAAAIEVPGDVDEISARRLLLWLQTAQRFCRAVDGSELTVAQVLHYFQTEYRKDMVYRARGSFRNYLNMCAEDKTNEDKPRGITARKLCELLDNKTAA